MVGLYNWGVGRRGNWDEGIFISELLVPLLIGEELEGDVVIIIELGPVGAKVVGDGLDNGGRRGGG